MKFRDAYRTVTGKILGLDHIRIEIIHKVDKTTIKASDPLQAFLMGLGIGLPDFLATLAQKIKQEERLKKLGITR